MKNQIMMAWIKKDILHLFGDSELYWLSIHNKKCIFRLWSIPGKEKGYRVVGIKTLIQEY